MSFNLDDYQTVDHRLDEFFARYPDGSIQSVIVEMTDSRVTVEASAYRTPDDQRPGVGLSSLAIPGSTPYTRGSELENAETSARGRALVALGFGSKASRDEIAAKAGASPVGAAQGTATDAAVSTPESSVPAAASPSAPLVQKAQEAAENLRQNQRPDIPVPIGDNKYQVTTFVERVDGPNDKGWHDIYVLIEGQSEKLSTKLKGLHAKAFDLQQTTAVVTYKETQNGSYVNRYLDSIEPAPELAETFAGVALPADDIPFAAVIW